MQLDPGRRVRQSFFMKAIFGMPFQSVCKLFPLVRFTERESDRFAECSVRAVSYQGSRERVQQTGEWVLTVLCRCAKQNKTQKLHHGKQILGSEISWIQVPGQHSETLFRNKKVLTARQSVTRRVVVSPPSILICTSGGTGLTFHSMQPQRRTFFFFFLFF